MLPQGVCGLPIKMALPDALLLGAIAQPFDPPRIVLLATAVPLLEQPGVRLHATALAATMPPALPGRDQCREVVLARHDVEMDSVLNTGSDVGGNKGQHPAEGRVDRIAVALGIFVHPIGKGLDDGGLLDAAG